MGAYLETADTVNKLDWLIQHGVPLPYPPTFEEALAMEKELMLPVVWLQNIDWNCIFIITSQNELYRATKNPRDLRPRSWFKLPIALIKENSGGFRHYYSGALQAPSA